VLDLLNLKKVLTINRIHNSFKITLHNSTEGCELSQENMDFIYIKNYHEKILPRYVEVHAIHSLTSKGYKLVNRDKLSDRYILTLEKRIGSNFPVRVDRYKITVLPQENIILIDGENMPGDNCRQYTKNFQRGIGKLESFTPYNSVIVRDVIGITVTYEKMPPDDKKEKSFLTNVCH
jgi:hypothetical protein